MTEQFFIYQILNTVNQNRYIGSSKKIEIRFKNHKKELKSGNHHCIALQRAWNKYGEENFIFETIKETNEENIILDEQLEINKYTLGKNIYNSNPIAGLPPVFKGEDRYNAVLTNEQAKEIRKEYNENNNINSTELAKKYNVNAGVIKTIVKNETYCDETYIPKNSYRYKPQIIHSGAEHINARFTKEEIKQIREEYNNTDVTLIELENKYEYDSINLLGIIHNKTYHDETYIPKDSYKYKKCLVNQNLANKIREEYSSTDIEYAELSEKYNLAVPTLCDIITNKSWYDENYIYKKRSKSLTNNKLDWDKVRSIRKEKSEGLSTKELVVKYGVSKSSITSIISLKSWIE